MQPVAAIVARQHLCRMFGVAQRLVEIGDPVEGGAVADPAVDRHTDLLALRVPGIGHVGLVAERRQRGADDLDAAAVGAQRHLLETGDHLRRGGFLLGLFPSVAQIVGAEHHDHVGDPGLG